MVLNVLEKIIKRNKNKEDKCPVSTSLKAQPAQLKIAVICIRFYGIDNVMTKWHAAPRTTYSNVLDVTVHVVSHAVREQIKGKCRVVSRNISWARAVSYIQPRSEVSCQRYSYKKNLFSYKVSCSTVSSVVVVHSPVPTPVK